MRLSLEAKGNVVYFNQLSGAANTKSRSKYIYLLQVIVGVLSKEGMGVK